MNSKQSKNWILMSMLILGLQAGLCQAVGTAITYQGKLELSGDLANGQFDFQFEVFSDAACLTSVAGPIFVNDLDVAMGLFTAIIDFGGGVFTGADRWLKISVRDGASVGAYTDLLPAQKVTATPYALFAENSGPLSLTGDPMLFIYPSGTSNPDKRIIAHSPSFPDWGLKYNDLLDQFEITYSSITGFVLQPWSGEFEAWGKIGLFDTIGGTEYASLGKNGVGGGVLRTYDELAQQTVILGSVNTGGGGFMNMHMADSIWAGVGLTASDAGVVTLNKSTGVNTFIKTVELDGDAGGGRLTMWDDADGSTSVILFDSGGGQLNLYNDSGSVRAILDGDSGDGGVLTMYNAAGNSTVLIDAESAGGAFVGLDNATGSPRITLDGDDGGGAGVITVDNDAGLGTIVLSGDDPDASTGGCVEMYDDAGNRTVAIDSDGNGTGSFMEMRSAAGVASIEMFAQSSGGFAGYRNIAGTRTISIDGDVSGDGRITTQELVITGGSDLSEQFDVADENLKPQPGMVVCIDAANPGKLQISGSPYDRKVAGIISGAGGVETGFMMSDAGTIADGEYPVALTGRVFCQVTTANGAIEPGDLLTTSAIPGHAMKVTDFAQSQGAILGKAMTALDKESGLVLVLVSLQ
jgi:hypothetical protein